MSYIMFVGEFSKGRQLLDSIKESSTINEDSKSEILNKFLLDKLKEEISRQELIDKKKEE